MSIDWRWTAAAAVFGLIGAALIFWGGVPASYMNISRLQLFVPGKRGLREKMAFLPRLFLYAAFILLLAALSGPHRFVEKTQPDEGPPSGIAEGIAVYLVLDKSGSMNEEVRFSGKKMTRMELLKSVTRDFIQGDPARNLRGRPNDLLGLVGFARTAQVLSPLTRDHKAIIERLSELKAVKSEEQLGTAIGYAIYKSVNMIVSTRLYGQERTEYGKPPYEIKSSVILLVTDGFQETNPEDAGHPLRSINIAAAADYARENNVRLYIVNIEPKLAEPQFAPYREVFSLSAQLTGGKFFWVDSTRDLADIYSEIDQLEKSRLPGEIFDKGSYPDLFRRIDYAPYFILSALACIFAAVLSEALFFRRAA